LVTTGVVMSHGAIPQSILNVLNGLFSATFHTQLPLRNTWKHHYHRDAKHG